MYVPYNLQYNTLAPLEPGCFDNELTCRNGHCVPANYRCDGKRDCFDGTDEDNCPGELFPAARKYFIIFEMFCMLSKSMKLIMAIIHIYLCTISNAVYGLWSMGNK